MHIHRQNTHIHNSKPKTELDHARTRNPTIPTSHSTLLHISNTTQHNTPLLHTPRVPIFELKTPSTQHNTTQHNTYPNIRIPKSFPPLDLLLFFFFFSFFLLSWPQLRKSKGKRERLRDRMIGRRKENEMRDSPHFLTRFCNLGGRKKRVFCCVCVREREESIERERKET